MMETIKRHLFLVVLGAGAGVLVLAAALFAYFGVYVPNARLKDSYGKTLSRANAVQGSPIYTSELVAEMARQVDLRKKQYDEVVQFIRKAGAARKPLLEGVFPSTTDTGKRMSFKSKYDEALRGFMKRLGAVPPPGADKEAARTEAEGAMYVHPKLSFYRPDWVDRPEAPNMDLVRLGQENIWLMEDVVEIIAKMNEELRPPGRPRLAIADSPVKELDEIRISYDYATLSGSKMLTGTGRYMPPPPVSARSEEKADKAETAEKAEAGPRALTLAGRWSQPGFYDVLPFRLIVVVESRFAGELIRRLKGTESFITVDAFRMKPVVEGSRDVMGPDRRAYGSQGIVRLEVVAESLVFQLERGRVTTPPPAKPA
ncbi:MAG: hypothetical protein IMZ44_08385 [Planctomycetes bacterium]|nr:hypothetical protein [Planctomycetota bacterium]